MYEPIRQQFFDFVTGLINLLMTPQLWFLVGPFVIMGVILWFMRWAWAQSRGRNLENMSHELDDLRYSSEDSIVRMDTINSPGYRQLRAQGYSTREIAHMRRQTPGSAVQPPSNRRLRIK